MDILKIKENIFDKALKYGFSDCEIYYDTGKSFSVKMFGGEIQEYKNITHAGLSFRGTYNGKVGYSFTEKISDDVVDLLIENAAKNSELIEEKEIETLYAGDSEYLKAEAYFENLNNINVEQKIDLALKLEKAAFAADPRVKSVDYCVLQTGEGENYIANSLGLNLKHKANYALVYTSVRVEENGSTKVAFDFWHGKDFADFDYVQLANKAAKRALSYLGASSIQSGKYPVAFENSTFIDLLARYSGIFFAEDVQKGFSLLKGKLNTKIASDCVTIHDDGICEKSLHSVPYDSEGVATKNKMVVENGVLKTYLYNLKSAKKDGVKSTGNGFKPSFRAAVDTSCTNFFIEPSETSFDKMIEHIQTGVFITDLQGLHSGTNTISGDFSLSASGFMIENGKITSPVEQITIAGNFFELLKNIDGVASDLKFDPPSGSGAIGTPSILVKELSISGK